MSEPTIRVIAGHNFTPTPHGEICNKCGRRLLDILPYGAPGACDSGDTGIACVGALNYPEVESLRTEYARQREIFDRLFK